MQRGADPTQWRLLALLLQLTIFLHTESGKGGLTFERTRTMLENVKFAFLKNQLAYA